MDMDAVIADIKEELKEHKADIQLLQKKMAEKDTQFAVINTKLSIILWIVGAIGTAVIGVLVKLIMGV